MWQNWGTSSLKVSGWQTWWLARGGGCVILLMLHLTLKNTWPWRLQTYHCFVTCGKTWWISNNDWGIKRSYCNLWTLPNHVLFWSLDRIGNFLIYLSIYKFVKFHNLLIIDKDTYNAIQGMTSIALWMIKYEL